MFLALLCLSLSSSVTAQKKEAPKAGQTAVAAGKLSFQKNTHDFGEVAEGPVVSYDFVFKNTGKAPVVISEAHGSCGCTVPEWPKEPVLPGKSGKIHVTFSTEGRPGPINKQVFITSNAAEPTTVLNIKGKVKPKAASSAVSAN